MSRKYTLALFWQDAQRGSIEWFAVTAMWYLVSSSDKQFSVKLGQALLGSFALTVLWNMVLYSIRNMLDSAMSELPKTRVYIQEEQLINQIKSVRPLWKHYLQSLSELNTRLAAFSQGQTLNADPYTIYSLILSCAENADSEIVSVDCDLGAWYYICEIEDFAILQLPSEDFAKITNEFLAQHRQRTRTDFTYRLNRVFSKRLNSTNGNAIQGRTPLKRIFVIQGKRNSLTQNEKLIIHRLKEIQVKIKGRMSNRFIFMGEKEFQTRDLLDHLKLIQDTIIFDGVTAFREYLLDPNDERKSEIIVNPEEIYMLTTTFNELWDKAVEIQSDFSIGDKK